MQPFSVLGHNGEINTIEQLRQEARALGVAIPAGGSDSQDLNRTIDHLIRVEGLSLAEAMELVVPPVVERDPLAARRPAPVLHVPARGDGAVRPGPGGADRAPRRRVRVLHRRARAAPALALETPDDHVFSSEPGVIGVGEMVSEPLPLGPGRSSGPIDREARARGSGARRDAARGRPPLARAHRRDGGGRNERALAIR